MLIEFQPGHYLAFELSGKCRANVLTLFQPRFSRVICHHVTIEFNLTPENFKKLKEKFNSSTLVRAYGYAKGDGVECIAVALGNETDRPDGSFYHITISIDPPHKPVESNKLKDRVVLIKDIFRSIEFLKLDGEFKLLKK